MEIGDQFIFQVEDPLVTQAYKTLNNYEIVFNEGIGVQKDLCVIYFSSNEIYYPNTAISFTRSIIERNKFEWQKNFIPYAYKHIFIRDIQKQWYIEGINAEINSPEKLSQLLLTLTNSFRVFSVGSSAGGFAAMLFGSMIKAERVYAFNAQLDITLIMKNSIAHRDPILFKYANDAQRSSFFKIENFVSSDVTYFYFQSCKSQMDISQYEAFGKKNLIDRIAFKTANHGFPFLRNNLPYVFNLPVSGLHKMADREIRPILFSIKVDGFIKTISIISKTIIDRFKKKMLEKKEARV